MDLLQHFLTSDKHPHSQYNAQFSQGLSAGYTLKAWQIGRFQSVGDTTSPALRDTLYCINSKQLECAKVIFPQVTQLNFGQTFATSINKRLSINLIQSFTFVLQNGTVWSHAVHFS